MHEVAIAQSILDITQDTARENNAKKILSINIKVGELSCVNLDSLQFAFECISQDTLAEGAKLVISQTGGERYALEMESIEVDE